MTENTALEQAAGAHDWAREAETLRALHAEQFGRWVLECRVSEDGGGVVEERPGAPWTSLWRRLAAEEALYALQIGDDAEVAGLLRALAQVKPFGANGPTLAEARKWPAWVATVPLDRPGCCSGTLVRIWGLRGAPQAGDIRLEGADTAPFDDFALHVGGLPESVSGIAGKSWQLGAWLGAECLERLRIDVQTHLATGWIVTGEIRGDAVLPVDLGNKTKLRTRKSWLFPEALEDAREIPARIRRLGRFCGNCADAWAHVSGEGTLSASGEWRWPEPGEVATLHTIVSESLRPMLAPILAARPRRVVLWHSGDETRSAGPAKMLEAFLADDRCRNWSGWAGAPPEAIRQRLPDRNLPDIERTFRRQGLASPETPGARVWVNITGGNLLMRMAALGVARLNPAAELLYRDFGNHPCREYVLVHHRQGRAFSRYVEAPDLPGVDWEFIVKNHHSFPIESVANWLGEVFPAS
jgi:hypothetical protein